MIAEFPLGPAGGVPFGKAGPARAGRSLSRWFESVGGQDGGGAEAGVAARDRMADLGAVGGHGVRGREKGQVCRPGSGVPFPFARVVGRHASRPFRVFPPATAGDGDHPAAEHAGPVQGLFSKGPSSGCMA